MITYRVDNSWLLRIRKSCPSKRCDDKRWMQILNMSRMKCVV